MIPIPPDIATRWRPMWHPDAHPERPWWRLVSKHTKIRGQPHVTWRRADGVTASFEWSGPIQAFAGSKERADELDMRGALDASANHLADIDRVNPMPIPRAMSGQVWCTPDGEITIGPFLDAEYIAQREGVWPLEVERREVNPSDNAILVSGPTPWGRDVPWTPSKMTT